MLDYRIAFNAALRRAEAAWLDAGLRLDADDPDAVTLVLDGLRCDLGDAFGTIDRGVLLSAVSDAMRGEAPRY